MMFLVSLAVLALLIFVHELGHFLVAKWCGVGVLEFSIGFGKKIFRKRFGETWYCIGIIPLGGYVRMVGDDPRMLPYSPEKAASSDPTTTPSDAPPLDEVEARLLADPSRWFLRKSYWPKFAIVAAGPAFNVLFALMLAIGAAAWFGKPVLDPIIGEVVAGLPGDLAGLRRFDRIVTLDGQPVPRWHELSQRIATSGGAELTLEVDRPIAPDSRGHATQFDRLTVKLKGVPPPTTIEAPVAVDANGIPLEQKTVIVGIRNLVGYEPLTFSEASRFGTQKVWAITRGTVVGLWYMIRGHVPASSIRGPIFIFGTAAKSAEQGPDALLDFMIFLSISLAILNLLPIPILDGGHIVFFTIERIKGSPVNIRVLEYANQFGMIVLMLLMAFAMGNDLLDVFRS